MVHSETRPVGVRKPRTLGPERNQELERLARLKGGLLAGSPYEAANVAAASLALAELAQCRATTRECGYGACRAGQVST